MCVTVLHFSIGTHFNNTSRNLIGSSFPFPFTLLNLSTPTNLLTVLFQTKGCSLRRRATFKSNLTFKVRVYKKRRLDFVHFIHSFALSSRVHDLDTRRSPPSVGEKSLSLYTSHSLWSLFGPTAYAPP